jgi:hypothetical protein
MQGFAQGRRLNDDVFWLKENAELLNILLATGAPVSPDDLMPYVPFYEDAEERLKFFPQYYRFLLSLAIDLEDLGMAGDRAESLCARAAREGLVDAELSDLQRAEARRLLARRGVTGPADPALDARLHEFISRPQTFALPNKKAAYELTHIVFYLSDYGARDPQLGSEALCALTYAGILAYLDQNADLLAEVCTALQFAGTSAPSVWQDAVRQAHVRIATTAEDEATLNDAYHEYLVTGWMAALSGAPAFETEISEGSLRFTGQGRPQGALRTLSECMYGLGDARSGDWTQMRPHVLAVLGPVGHEVLVRAESSTEVFEPFFESFARAR